MEYIRACPRGTLQFGDAIPFVAVGFTFHISCCSHLGGSLVRFCQQASDATTEGQQVNESEPVGHDGCVRFPLGRPCANASLDRNVENMRACPARRDNDACCDYFSFSQDYTATIRRSSIGVTKSRARCMPSLTQFMGRANGVLMDGATSETTRVAYCLEKRMTHFTHTVRFQPPNPRR